MPDDSRQPKVYSIAAHRGFADALVAGLVPRYSEPDFGLARLTLLLPGARAVRVMQEAFIRHSGTGLLMPRMVVVGDLDLDEALGAVLDPLGAVEVLSAVDQNFRWLRLAELIRQEDGGDRKGSALLRLAQETGRVMDRLLAEEIAPDSLWGDAVMDIVGDLSGHWARNLHLFARVQARWQAELAGMGQTDVPARRNALFRRAATRWRDDPPATPIVAAGITGAAPALAAMLRSVAQLPNGAVVLPDLDLAMAQDVWDELGAAGDPAADEPLGRHDATTHPQYHLKLLLNRMGIARHEVQQWHRAGAGKGPPERSHAISSLFLPPQASKTWATLSADKRRLSGVRMMESAHPEHEAQAIAMLVRQALDVPEKRIAVITPDRGLAARVAQHLRRWNVEADDSAGQPLAHTTAGRLLLLLAEVGATHAAPVPLVALLQHPLVRRGDGRGPWLQSARALELALRGPRPAPGLGEVRRIAAENGLTEWWAGVEPMLAPLLTEAEAPLADLLDRLVMAGEALCGDVLWADAGGRAMATLLDDVRLAARAVGTLFDPAELPTMLRDVMDRVAVRPPYGGHPRVAILGLLEARMARADMVICAGLNEGVWPASPATDPLLAPAVLRALGVPGADFRIGLAAHDLAGMLGAPEVVLSRAVRDAGGPAIASRFWLRVQALLGDDLLKHHLERDVAALARAIDNPPRVTPHARPRPEPTADQRKVAVSVTALDRLRSDPYQFYAGAILQLKELEPLDAEPSAAWQGIAAHEILERWHTAAMESPRTMHDVAAEVLQQMNGHPLMRALWRPRLMAALEWVELQIAQNPDRAPAVFERWGNWPVRGVTIRGKVDRIDRLPDGTLAIVDYKTGSPPSGKQVENGFALQLGTLGLMARAGAFDDMPAGEATCFEYWSLARHKNSPTGFGHATTPLKTGNKRSGIAPEEFLPAAEYFLHDALDRWILGAEPFTARLNPDAKTYSTYDQLMRLDEWIGDL